MVKANDWTAGLPKKQTATYVWNTDYAYLVHDGFTLNSGEEAPPRPWVWVTADQFDFLDSFLKNINDSNKPVGELIKEAFAAMSNEFGKSMLKNMEDPIWAWPRTTQRRSGELAGSPRNIVDLGELINSYSYSVTNN